MGKFEELYALNVNDKTEKKGQLTYLSWAWAWAEFKKAYPDANYKVNQFDGTFCTGNDKLGYMVNTQVTAGEQTHEMWLPVMDARNNTILQPKMTEINKTIMRCLTKNLAMFGLGLYIYAGEDLPEDEGKPTEEDKKPSKAQKPAQKQPQLPQPTNNTEDTEKGQKKAVSKAEKLTRTELVQTWGLNNAEEWIAWLEKKIGYVYDDWTDEEHETARKLLKATMDKRKAEADKIRKEAQEADVDKPF